MHHLLVRAVTLALCSFASTLSLGQATQGQAPAPTFPVKPVRVIVGYAAGGGNDVIMRIVGQKLAENLGQPVVIENKPGAASIIAADYVAKAPPDGYTLLMGPSGPMVFNLFGFYSPPLGAKAVGFESAVNTPPLGAGCFIVRIVLDIA